MVDIPTRWMKVEGDVEARWVSMESWQVRETMLWLWLPHQCRESNPDLNVDKYPENLWMVQVLHHVAFATDMCARVFKRLVFPMQSCVKDCWLLCALCCGSVVSWISETPDGWSFVIDKIMWTVNILDAAETDWNSKYKVPQHLHYYFYIFFYQSWFL